MNLSEHIEYNLKETYLEKLKAESEREIKDEAADYITKYQALYHIQQIIKRNPGLIDARIISALQEVLNDTRFLHQRQSLFFYRMAAEALSSILVHSSSRSLADGALSSLKSLLSTASGNSHRATAEAMGLLPFSLGGPEMTPETNGRIPQLSWQQAVAESGLGIEGQPVFFGRSMAARIKSNGHLLVFKLARAGEPAMELIREARWMAYLHDQRHRFKLRFNIPRAVRFRKGYLFRFTRLPWKLPGQSKPGNTAHAIGFVAHRDYFQYPNRLYPDTRAAEDNFLEIMSRNAWLLGRLASQGIVHTAPIPLFHNRVQVDRRRDRGLYEWYRGGRLDRWLESCLYPNLGITGIRDFEHFISVKASNHHLYRFIGNHILGLLLIAGSYFRNQDPQKAGCTPAGKPLDARHLFDRSMLTAIIHRIFSGYYEGFVERPLEENLPLNIDFLCSRMVEEMGIDRHMYELLRVVDQDAMSDDDFRRFMRERGYGDQEVLDLKKGQQDLRIQSGPHLGGFNQQISLPEMIEAVATMSALCIAGRYWQLNFKG